MNNGGSHQLQIAVNRSTLLTLVKYGASIGILVWLFSANRDQFNDFLVAEKQLYWLPLACLTILLAFGFSYIRWQQLANAIGMDLSLIDATRLGFIGSFFNVVAFGVVGGDSLRAFYAARHCPGRVPEAILSVFIDRFIGLMVMFTFAAVGAILVRSYAQHEPLNDAETALQYACHVAGIVAIIGWGGLLTFVFFPGISRNPLVRWFERLPKVGPLIEQGVKAAALFSQNKLVIAKAAALSLGTNLLFAVTIFLVACAVSPNHPELIQHLVIAPISMVANSLPLPGGVGGMEAALSSMYEGYGADNGLIVALGYRLCILLVSLIGWFVWVFSGKSMQPEVA